MVFDGVRWWGVDGCSVVGVDGGLNHLRNRRRRFQTPSRRMWISCTAGLKADSLDCPGSDGPGRLHDYGRPCLSMDNGRPSTDTKSNGLEVQRW